MWDLASGEEITTFSGHAAPALITGIAFSPDGKTVLTGADDKFAYQWDAATGQESRAFSGEGLATAGADGSIRTYTLQLDQLTALARARRLGAPNVDQRTAFPNTCCNNCFALPASRFWYTNRVLPLAALNSIRCTVWLVCWS